jgi:hypothetical protein
LSLSRYGLFDVLIDVLFDGEFRVFDVIFLSFDWFFLIYAIDLNIFYLVCDLDDVEVIVYKFLLYIGVFCLKLYLMFESVGSTIIF